MREHYGETQAQSVSDHKWIAMTAECGWIGFHKDANIRRNAVERRTVLDTEGPHRRMVQRKSNRCGMPRDIVQPDRLWLLDQRAENTSPLRQ